MTGESPDGDDRCIYIRVPKRNVILKEDCAYINLGKDPAPWISALTKAISDPGHEYAVDQKKNEDKERKEDKEDDENGN